MGFKPPGSTLCKYPNPPRVTLQNFCNYTRRKQSAGMFLSSFPILSVSRLLRISSAVAEVDVHDLCISVAGRDLLKDAHLKLCPGQRYGFVGRNGSGKSTLFRSMATGRIPGYPANCVTLLVDQEDVGDEDTAVETVAWLRCDVEMSTAPV